MKFTHHHNDLTNEYSKLYAVFIVKKESILESVLCEVNL